MKIYCPLATTAVFCTAAIASPVSAAEGPTTIETDQSGGNSNQQFFSLFYNNHHLRNGYQNVLKKFAVQANSDLNEKKEKMNGGNSGATRDSGLKKDHGHRHRILQSLTQSEFDNYFCDLFEFEFGARCNCDGRSLTMKCDLGEKCMPYPSSSLFPEGTATDCPADENGEVCFDSSMRMKLTQFGGMLDIDYVEMVMVYTGMDYSAERVIMWPRAATSSVSNSKCEMYYSIDDLEYKCNTCRMCTDELVTFDCSNISPDFSAVCINVDNMDAVNDLMFDYCPVGGAPQPTTQSVGPVPKPITVGSGSSSSSIISTVTSSSPFARFIIIVPVVASIITAAAGI